MSIRWYKTFLAVARSGSFAAASEEIGLTKAAVSVQMAALEDQLGVRLFDRSARTVALNPAGRELVNRARELVTLYDAMGNGLGGRATGGTLALGAIHHTFTGMLPDTLLRLRRAHPGIAVHVCNGPSNELMHKVEQGELDCAVVAEPPFKLPRALAWQALAREPLALVAPAKLVIAGLAETLATQPFIGVSRNSWTGQLTRAAFHTHGLKTNEVMELNSLEAIAGMVARGFGVSILPLSGYVQALGKRVQVAVLTKPGLTRTIGLIRRHDNANPALVAALHDCLVAALPNIPLARLRRIALDS